MFKAITHDLNVTRCELPFFDPTHLPPHLIKLIVTCIRLGKKEGKTDNKVTFSIHSSRSLKIMLKLSGMSHEAFTKIVSM